MHIPGPTILKRSLHWRFRKQALEDLASAEFSCKLINPNGSDIVKPYRHRLNSEEDLLNKLRSCLKDDNVTSPISRDASNQRRRGRFEV